MAMQSDIDYHLVRDPRLQKLSSKIDFPVRSGAQNFTSQQFSSNTSSSSNISFTIQPSSESTCIDRHVFIQSKINWTVTFTGAGAGIPVGDSILSYLSLQSLPLNRLFNQVSCSVNNSNVNLSQADMMDGLLRLVDQKDLQSLNGMTPTFLDNYSSLSDSIGANNSPISGYKGAGYDNYLAPRGSWPITLVSCAKSQGGTDGDNVVSENVTNLWTLGFSTTVTEPLLLSPFLFSEINKAALVGINNIALVFNVDSSMKRFMSIATPGTADVTISPGIAGGNLFENTKILMNFLTIPQTMSIPHKIATPMLQYDRYITQASTAALAAGASAEYTLSSIQLDKVPSKILVYARKRLSDQTAKDSDTFFGIESCSIQFGNKSGILSNADKIDLYNLSRNNGVQSSYLEWVGETYNAVKTPAGVTTAAQANVANSLSSVGSVLCLSPAYDFGLDPYISSSSLGQYTLQMKVRFKNISKQNLQPEIVVVIISETLLTTTAGNSSLYSGLLNFETVMETIQKDSQKAVPMMGNEGLKVGGLYSGGLYSGGSSKGKSVKSRLDMLNMHN